MEGEARGTRSTGEGSASGFRWRAIRAGDRHEIVLAPRQSEALRPILGFLLWLLAVALVFVALVRTSRNVLFVPIVLFPLPRFYRTLCAKLNRIAVTLDRSRFRFRQGPLPRGELVELATQDVASFREVELDDFGNWVGEPQRSWSVRVLTHAGERIVLPIALPTRDLARLLADLLADSLDLLRAPVAYRK